MIVTRSALMLHLQNPPIRYHFFSHFLNPTFPSVFKPRPFSLTTLRQTHARPFVSAVASASSSQVSNGRDTFFAEENVSWTALGLSDTISRALSDIGLNRPSLVQVPSPLFHLPCIHSRLFPRCPFVNSCSLRVFHRKLNDPIR